VFGFGFEKKIVDGQKSLEFCDITKTRKGIRDFSLVIFTAM